jgi:ABC-type Zn uptake system ZnuABC Zn-binding protein ZnuA
MNRIAYQLSGGNRMKVLKKLSVYLLVFVFIATTTTSVRADRKPEVVLTIPTLTDITKRIGGDRFTYTTLAVPNQDPHYVQATPSLMKQVNDADLFLQIGMNLEIWADQIAQGSGNPKIYRGNDGRVILSGPIPKLQVPKVASRAKGHIHPQGNPHFWLDPVRTKMLADQILDALVKLKPDAKEAMQTNLNDFRDKINRNLYGEKLVRLVGENKLDRLALDGKLWSFLRNQSFGGTKLIDMAGPWLNKARVLQGENVIEYHQEWVYFVRTFGMNLVGTVEEKPGIPPGPQHIKKTMNIIENNDVKVILVDTFYDPSSSRKIARNTPAEVVIVPSQVGGAEGTDGYFQFMDHLLDEISRTIQTTNSSE